MLISEKGLCHAMSDAAAHGGYKLRFNEDEETLTVVGHEWLINVEMGKIPRKALALLVEHFGYLPGSGCFSVKKTKDSFDVQSYMNETFNADVALIAMGTPEAVLYTGISVWSMELFISESGALRGASPENFGLLQGNPKAQIIPERSLCYIDEDGAVFITVSGGDFLPDIKRPIWDSLEQIDWWKAKDAEPEQSAAPEDEGEQIMLEERDEVGGDD